MPRPLAGLLSAGLLLAPLLLTGCLTTAKNTRTAATFSAADLDSVAVVFSEGGIAEKDFWVTTPDSAATATANHLVPRLLSEFAPHFGVTLVDAREALAENPVARDNALVSLGEAVETIRSENREVARMPFAAGLAARNAPVAHAVARDLVEVSERTGTRYLLSVSVAGWDATAGEKVADALVRGAAAAAGVLVSAECPTA